MPYSADRHGPKRVVGPGFHAAVHAVVRRVPAGRVTTFGDVAEVLGMRRVARHVGYALAALPAGSDVPWFRVLNAKGVLGCQTGGEPSSRQRQLLADEGTECDERGRIVSFRKLRMPVDALRDPDEESAFDAEWQ